MTRAVSTTGTQRTSPSRTTNTPTGRAATPKPPPDPLPSPSPPGPGAGAATAAAAAGDRGDRDHQRAVALDRGAEDATDLDAVVGLREQLVDLHGSSSVGARGHDGAVADAALRAVLLRPLLGRRVGPVGSGPEHSGHLALEVADGPAPVVAGDALRRDEGGDVLDEPAAHRERLPADPLRVRRREVADELGDVDRALVVERPRAAWPRCGPCASRPRRAGSGRPGRMQFAVAPNGASSVAIASVKARHPGLRRRVVGLAGAGHEQQAGRGVDHPSVRRARPPCARCATSGSPGAVTENVPLRWTRITSSHSSSARLKTMRGPPEAGVVHHDVDAAPLVERPLDHGLAARGGGDVVVVGHRLAARGADLRGHLLGRGLVGGRCRRSRRRGR